MTISRKDRMLHIILQLEEHAHLLSPELKENLDSVKNQLDNLEEAEVNQLTDKVFSRPATEQGVQMTSPEYRLHACYDELDLLTRNGEAPEALQKAVQEMRYYYSIEEKDGFFP